MRFPSGNRSHQRHGVRNLQGMQVDGRRGRKGGEIRGTLALVRPQSFGHGADDLPIDNPPHPGYNDHRSRSAGRPPLSRRLQCLPSRPSSLATPPPRSRPCRRDHPEGQVRGHLRPAPLLDQPAAKCGTRLSRKPLGPRRPIPLLTFAAFSLTPSPAMVSAMTLESQGSKLRRKTPRYASSSARQKACSVMPSGDCPRA